MLTVYFSFDVEWPPIFSGFIKRFAVFSLDLDLITLGPTCVSATDDFNNPLTKVIVYRYAPHPPSSGFVVGMPACLGVTLIGPACAGIMSGSRLTAVLCCDVREGGDGAPVSKLAPTTTPRRRRF